MTETRIPTAAVLIIGNEILSGRTTDSNLNYIAKKLGGIGIRLSEARVVPDIETEIVDAVNALRKRYTYLFTTGGIGSTHDDITVDAIAKAFGVPVVVDPEAKALLESHYPPGQLTEVRLRMARVPEGAKLIKNPVSAAPGIHIGNIYILAGVPNIMQAMIDGIAATLTPGPKIYSQTVSCSAPENAVADDLRALAEAWPQLDIGSYPWFRNGGYGTSLVVRGIDENAVKTVTDAVFAMVGKHNGKPVME